jgi:predicted RNase H-like HicB family nuclease
MEFPVAIHKDEGSVYGVIVPDIAGCHSWGDTIEQAIHNTREAIESHVSTLIECGEEVDLSVTPVEVLVHQPEYAGAGWALVDVDPAKFDTKPLRVNISLPRFVLRKIDAYAGKHHETRSGFLARVALDAIREEERTPA